MWNESDPVGAVDRVADDMGQDWVKDPIYRDDVLQWLKGDPDVVIARLDSADPPRRGLPVPVPKTGLTIRPATNLRVLDRVCYQALVETFSLELLADLPTFVSGWRYKDDPQSPNDLADNGVEWRFYQQQLLAEWARGCEYVLATDIAGFFQYIPHDLLRERIGTIDRQVRNLLFDYLRVWNPRGIGLPQRVLASSLLANAYLDPLDAVLGDYAALRWMDDIVVLCDSRREGVEVLLRIQQVLEPLYLQLNESKTYLLPYEETSGLTVDIRLGTADYALHEGEPGDAFYEAGENTLFDVWHETMERPERADRTKFSYCVTRFIDYEYADPVAEVLAALTVQPHVADHASRYLREYLTNVRVLRAVHQFLRGRDNQYVWQEYRLATLFWHAERLSNDQLGFIRRRASSRDTYWAARQVYVRALAKHGRRADAQEMAQRAESELDGEMLRGLVIAGAEAGLGARRLREMGRDDPDLRRLIDYLVGRGRRVPRLSF